MGKSKIGYETKVEIVRNYLSGKMGYKESIRRANNSTSSFRHWVALYKSGGAQALLRQSRNKRYKPEEKIRAVRQYLTGKGSLEEICEKYGMFSSR